VSASVNRRTAAPGCLHFKPGTLLEPRPPVVVLGGLAIVRALGMAGIPAIVASAERDTPAIASRYCIGSVALPSGASRDALVETLIGAGRWLAERHGRPVPLFYGNDDSLRLVQDCRTALAPHFALLLNQPDLAAALLDKARFQALAESRGLPVPRYIGWNDLAQEPGPVLAKPKVHVAWDHSALRERLFGAAGKARVFDCGRAARLDRLMRQFAGELAFQEYIPGDDTSLWSFHGFAAPGGALLEWFTGRKIRTSPALTGESSHLGLAREPELEALGRDIAAKLGLAGIFKMDFKRHAESGRFYLLEINARFNLWHYLAAKNGVNLARVAYGHLISGERPQPSRWSTRYRWLAFQLDWAAYRELHAAGRLSLAGWVWSLLQAPKIYELFSWSDPAPFVRLWHSRMQRRWKRLWQPTAS